jgi:hypothetical protein
VGKPVKMFDVDKSVGLNASVVRLIVPGRTPHKLTALNEEKIT